TMSMNAGFQNASESAMAARSTTADATAFGRSRPARPCSFGTGSFCTWSSGAGRSAWVISDLDELGFLVLEEVVDLVGVGLGHRVETLLGARDVVLADLSVLLQLLQALLGVPAQVADRHATVLGL